MDYSRAIARAALEIKAIKLNTSDPFVWASGYFMPIYNDNRMFLFYDDSRRLIVHALHDKSKNLPFSIIAGTSTAGIPWATLLAKNYKSPLIYIRDKPKNHGLKNQIEGIGADEDLSGHHALLIEDLISTGKSSVNAIKAIRNANGSCNCCLSIFNYSLEKSIEEFKELNPECYVYSLLNYETLLDVAKEDSYISNEQIKILEEWREDPLSWGEKNGFSPRLILNSK